MLNLPLTKNHLIKPITVLVFLILFQYFITSLAPFFILKADQHSLVFLPLITTHFLHNNWPHLGLNAAGIVIIWMLHAEHYNIRNYIGCLLLSSIGVGIGIFYFTDYSRYVGLSGVLHALIIFGAIKDIQKNWKTGWLLLFGIVLKVVYELSFITSTYNTAQLIGTSVAVEAHFFGIICGGVCALFFQSALITHPIKNI